MRLRKFHIYDFPLEKTYVLLDRKYQQSLIRYAVKMSSGTNELARKIKVVHARIWQWYNYKTKNYKTNKLRSSFIRLDKFLDILEITKNKKFNKKNFERHVFCIRGKTGNPIYPKLPIEEDERLVRLLMHLICDGFAEDNMTPCYFNKDSELVNEFEGDLKLFGHVPINRNGPLIQFPPIIAYFIKNIYKIEMKSHISEIPKEIFSLPKKFAKEVIEVFVDDEGYIGDSNINIWSVNEKLLSQLRCLLISKFSEIPKDAIGSIKRDRNCLFFKIKSGALEQFNSTFQLTSRRKRIFLEEIVKRKKRNWFSRPKNETKSIIVGILKKPLTTKEIAVKAGIHYTNASRHLYALKNKGIVKKCGRSKYGSTLWVRNKL